LTSALVMTVQLACAIVFLSCCPHKHSDSGEEVAIVVESRLPKFDHYYLDESDPDISILRRQDGAFVAAFSARGFTKEGIIEAAQANYRALLEEAAVIGVADRTAEPQRG
jgi:hypothetical protein